MPKNIAYFRVSTQEQDLEKNKADILRFANEKELGKVDFVEEKISGTVSWRKRKIADVLETLQEGDSILISEFSRLVRMYGDYFHRFRKENQYLCFKRKLAT